MRIRTSGQPKIQGRTGRRFLPLRARSRRAVAIASTGGVLVLSLLLTASGAVAGAQKVGRTHGPQRHHYRQHTAPPVQPAPGDVLDAKALQKVLDAQALPRLQVVPVTATSHPFNGALWQNAPIDLANYGYVEKEYYDSGTANVYNWVANTNYNAEYLRSGSYTDRVLVREPADMRTWSGRVIVELLNSSAGYDWAAIWSANWEQILGDHDVYVGITAKPSDVLAGMKRFDPTRYGPLNWANPDGATTYENGFIWDIATQMGRLLKSPGHGNPLGRPAKAVLLSGESQQANFLATYYKWFTPAAYFPDGKPIFDGYLAECQVGANPTPINQQATPLASTDPQRTTYLPGRPVPWMGLNSQWDFTANVTTSANTSKDKVDIWELAGANHGWAWQYLYGDASAADLAKAGFAAPSTYDWFTTVNNPEVPLYMAEKAAYEELYTWISRGIEPPRANPITVQQNPTTGSYSVVYDSNNNAEGGLRLPMMAVPIASFGTGGYALVPPNGLTSTSSLYAKIVPFSTAVLHSLYSSKQDYIAKYTAVAMNLVKQGFLLRSDAFKLIEQANMETSITW